MRNLIIKIFITFMCVQPAHSIQNDEEDIEANKKFDSIYFNTAVVVSGSDVNRALQIADSLYSHSATDIHKVKSLMLSSTLFSQKGEIHKSMQYALLANNLAEKRKMADWQARISGFLSTQFRNIGLHSKGREYLEKGINASKNVSTDQLKTLFMGMVYQESAHYEIFDKNYLKAKEFTLLAEKQINKRSEGVNKNYFIATNRELLGWIYLHLEKYDESLANYEEGLDILRDISEDGALLNGLIYSGLAKLYLEKEDLENALKYLQLAEQIAESSDYLGIKLRVYKSFSKYYSEVDNHSSSIVYYDKYLDAMESKEVNKSNFIRSFVDTMEFENQALTKRRYFLKAVVIFLILIFVIAFIYYRRKKKKDLNRFNALIAHLKEKGTLDLAPAKNKTEPQKSKDKKNIMSEEVEVRILKGLKEFEESNKFTNKDMSISVLAGLLKTNTKYLSHVLNTHKNKDFNSYINSLRIQYIINKIEVDDQYRKYKISYLAEKSGFSSHSKFTNVFKTYTGFTPSLFMEYLEKDNKKKIAL